MWLYACLFSSTFHNTIDLNRIHWTAVIWIDPVFSLMIMRVSERCGESLDYLSLMDLEGQDMIEMVFHGEDPSVIRFAVIDLPYCREYE